jgi:predicted double-glycine peptidase
LGGSNWDLRRQDVGKGRVKLTVCCFLDGRVDRLSRPPADPTRRDEQTGTVRFLPRATPIGCGGRQGVHGEITMRGSSLGKLALYLTAAAGVLTAADSPTPDAERAIPPGAVTVELPDVRQPDGFSCGASALMAVCRYYGVGPGTIDAFKAELGTNPERGTDYRAMVDFARRLGLDARAIAGLDPDRLEAAVAAGHPVIVSIQAYAADPEVYRNPRSNEDGHFVIVIGFDATNYYVEDPSLEGHRGFLRKAEFLRRWHDDEGTPGHPEVIERLGLEFGPGRTGGPCLRRAARVE